LPNDFNPSHIPSNPISGFSLRPEQASPVPPWWTSATSEAWPIPSSRFEAKCGYCQGVPAYYELSCPDKPTSLHLPIDDQILEKKPLVWFGSFLPENFPNANAAFVNFQLNLEPLLNYACCSWKSRTKTDVTLEVSGTQPPVFKSMSLKWYLFYGKTDASLEYGATPTFGPLGLNGLPYGGSRIAAVTQTLSNYATGPYLYSDESKGLYFGPEVFDEKEEISLDVEGWTLVLLDRFTDEYLDPISGLGIQYPRWALAAAYTVEGRFKCCEPTTWNLVYNPCNQPDHQIISTPFQP
jgi:hypothetical protein